MIGFTMWSRLVGSFSWGGDLGNKAQRWIHCLKFAFLSLPFLYRKLMVIRVRYRGFPSGGLFVLSLRNLFRPDTITVAPIIWDPHVCRVSARIWLDHWMCVTWWLLDELTSQDLNGSTAALVFYTPLMFACQRKVPCQIGTAVVYDQQLSETHQHQNMAGTGTFYSRSGLTIQMEL